MHNTQLYIENQEIELDSQVHFAITREFEILENPTVYVSEWTKTVSIPGTAANNRLFGHIYNPDMMVVSSSSLTYINFDPTKRLDFRLVYDGAVLMTGYAKITEITRKKGDIRYSCTLNGTVAKIFQELSKIRFLTGADTSTTEDLDYVIDTSPFFHTSINCSTMHAFFNNSQSNKGVYDVSGNINPYLVNTDIVGFAPNIYYAGDDFDYTLYQYNNSQSKSFADAINNNKPRLRNVIDGENIYPDGPKPREIGEFRTYLQLPYIYVNKLFQIVAHKLYELTDYRFILDRRWFFESNDYWYNLAMMLQPLTYNEDNKTSIQNYYDGMDASADTTYNAGSTVTLTALNTKPYHQDVQIADMRGSGSQLFANTSTSQYTSLNLTMRLYFSFDSAPEAVMFDDQGGIEVTLQQINASRSVMRERKILINSDSMPISNPSVYDEIVYVGNMSQENNMFYYDVPLGWSYINPAQGSYYSFRVLTHHIAGMSTVSPLLAKYSGVWSPVTGTFHYTFSGSLKISFSTPFKSYDDITLSDLWNHDYKPWDIIVNYCRMFRLLINVDETKRAIQFIPAKYYFKSGGQSYADWTDKVDLTSDFKVTPVYWGAHNVLFNYDEDDTKLGEDYVQKFGFQYGDKNIRTDYNFDTETNQIFSGLKTSITTTPSVLSWTSVYDYETLAYSKPSTEIYVAAGDEDDKLTNVFGRFYFHRGQAAFDSSQYSGDDLMLRPVYITDDTPLQIANTKYFYSQSADPSTTLQTLSYQYLDIAKGANLCIFEKPYETYSRTSLTGRRGVYENFWQKYINERYSVQSKKVTCYIDIKPIDYLGFDFNRFVRIGSQLYFVNKIYDYDVTTTSTTKVDLINITDVNNYYTDNFQAVDGYFDPDEDWTDSNTDLTIGEEASLYIDATDDLSWAIESPGVFDVVPSSGSGAGQVSVKPLSTATAGQQYSIIIYNADSPFTSLSEKEHCILKVTPVSPSE